MKDDNDNLCLNSTSEYYYQIQGQMMVTGARNACLVVYTVKDTQTMTVPRDEPKIQEIMCKMEEFYDKYFKPALFDKYIYKYYSKCFKSCDHHDNV